MKTKMLWNLNRMRKAAQSTLKPKHQKAGETRTDDFIIDTKGSKYQIRHSTGKDITVVEQQEQGCQTRSDPHPNDILFRGRRDGHSSSDQYWI